MKTLHEIRRDNLKVINNTYEKQVDFADRLSLASNYLNQLLTGHRNIGEKIARKIETSLKLEPYALDRDPNAFNEPPADYLITQPQLNDTQKILLELFDALPYIEQQKLIDSLKEQKIYWDTIYNELSSRRPYGLKNL